MKTQIKLLTVSAAIMTIIGITDSNSTNSNVANDNISLANIEALSNDEYSGKPCYNKGNYNIDKPDALVCGTPCKMKPWNTPLWGGTSYCQ